MTYNRLERKSNRRFFEDDATCLQWHVNDISIQSCKRHWPKEANRTIYAVFRINAVRQMIVKDRIGQEIHNAGPKCGRNHFSYASANYLLLKEDAITVSQIEENWITYKWCYLFPVGIIRWNGKVFGSGSAIVETQTVINLLQQCQSLNGVVVGSFRITSVFSYQCEHVAFVGTNRSGQPTVFRIRSSQNDDFLSDVLSLRLARTGTPLYGAVSCFPNFDNCKCASGAFCSTQAQSRREIGILKTVEANPGIF